MRLLLVLALLVAFPAQAGKPEQPLSLNYSLYTGGLRVVDIDVNYLLTPKAYDVYAVARTRGMWKSLVPWRNMIKSYGTISRTGQVQPQGARYDDVWRERARTTEFSFKPEGTISVVTNPPHRRDARVEATANEKRGSLDAVTALMAVMARGAEKGCSGSIRAFDGRRLFNLVMTNKGTEQMQRIKYNMYSGPAVRCEIVFEKLAGFPPPGTKSAGFWSAQDNADKRNPLIVWIARPAPGMPEMPVRVQSNTEYGTIVAHLRSAADHAELTAMAPTVAAR